jgi:hypothetical protein
VILHVDGTMPATLNLFLGILLFRSLSWAQICAVEGYFAGQNLAIADISGSTPTHYPDDARRPQPSTAFAWSCIRMEEHRALQAGTYPNNVEPKKTDSPGVGRESSIPAVASEYSQNSKSFEYTTSKQATPEPCKANALLFARGTIPDWGTMGSVGDALSRALLMRRGQADDWYFEDVKYWNDGIGFSCYGLPGGRVALDQLNALGSRCNNTKIVVGGFSQGINLSLLQRLHQGTIMFTRAHFVDLSIGAMVARIAVANAAPSIRDRVAAVVTFGDPVSIPNWRNNILRLN